jgi:hypothetical protein
VNSWGWLDKAIILGLENVKRKLENVAIKKLTLKYLVNKKYNERYPTRVIKIVLIKKDRKISNPINLKTKCGIDNKIFRSDNPIVSDVGKNIFRLFQAMSPLTTWYQWSVTRATNLPSPWSPIV